MREFKEHSEEEVTVPPTISHNLSSSSPLPVDDKSSGYIMSRSLNGSFPRQEEYKLEYWGRYEVPPPASGTSDQVVLIDTLVAKFREAAGTKIRPKKRSFGSRFMYRNSSAKVSAAEGAGSPVDADKSSLGDAKDTSCPQAKNPRNIPEKQDIPITFTLPSPTGEEEPEEEEGEGEGGSLRGASTSPEDPADHHSSCHQTTDPHSSGHQTTSSANLANHHSSCHELAVTTPTELTSTAEPNGRIRTESTDFDTLPELANLKGSSEFQALSLKKSSGSVQPVRLLFSGVSVLVYPHQSQEVILKKSIQHIACCAQVS